jgi:hypothetical protein
MKIYAISLIKNESDIIAQNLIAASKWADKIFVFDNGSTDGTWQIVNDLRSEKIIPYKSSDIPYRDSIRQEVFEHFRNELNDGDWVCFKLDADEFYIDNPRIFLSKLKPWISLVFAANIEYQFTLDNLDQSSNKFDFNNFRYALVPSCEQRFIKYRDKLVWNKFDSLPTHPGFSTKKLIKFAHYQFRTPNQIAKRLATRTIALNSGYTMYWDRDLNMTWESKIIDKEGLIEINADSDLDIIIKNSKIRIHDDLIKRVIKFVMHGCKFWP